MMQLRSRKLRPGPLPEGNRRGASGAVAGCHSMRSNGDAELSRRAPIEQYVTAAVGPLPEGDRRGAPGAAAGCHSMRSSGDEELSRRAPIEESTTAENREPTLTLSVSPIPSSPGSLFSSIPSSPASYLNYSDSDSSTQSSRYERPQVRNMPARARVCHPKPKSNSPSHVTVGSSTSQILAQSHTVVSTARNCRELRSRTVTPTSTGSTNVLELNSVTPAVSATQEANAFKPASTKAGKPRVRMRWSDDVNLFIMRTYYKITKLETDLTTYRKTLHEHFIAQYPGVNVSEQRVSDQRRTIIRNKMISDEVLVQLKEEVRTELEQTARSPSPLATHPNSMLTIDLLTNTSDQTATGVIPETTSILTENENEILPPLADATENRLRENLQTALDQYTGSDPTIRPKLPKLKYSIYLTQLVDLFNRKILQLFISEDSQLIDIHTLVYCSALVISQELGYKTEESDQPRRMKGRKPAWCIRLENDITQLRSDIGRLTQYINNNRTRRVVDRVNAIFRNFKVHSSHENNNKRPEEFLDTLKQKLALKAHRLKRYNKALKRKKDNKLFNTNEKIFYRQLTNPEGDTSTTNAHETPEVSELELFWAGIWETELQHNEEASWIKGEELRWQEMEGMKFEEITEADLDNDDSVYSVDSDSYYSETETSVYMRTEPESDGESASGHRVTPDMVLLLMLKENGAITEEQYNEKAEKCERNFRFLIPKLPRSRTSSYDLYTRELSEAEESNYEEENNDSNAGVTDKEVEVNDENEGTLETSNVSKVECDKHIIKDGKDIESIEKVENFKEGAFDLPKNDTYASLDGINNKPCCKENTLLEKQQGNEIGNQMECEEEEEKIQDYPACEEIKKEKYQGQQKPIHDNLSSEKNVDSAIQETNRDCNKYIVSECIGTESMKNYESQKQVEDMHVEKIKNHFLDNNLVPVKDRRTVTDTNATNDPDNQVALTKPGEKAKQDHNSGNEKGEIHKDILQGLNLAPVEDNRIETNNNSIIEENEHLIKAGEKFKEDQNSKNENEETNNLLQENNLESVEEKSKETINNASQSTTKQDLELTKPAENSKIETETSQTEFDLPTGKITKSFKYILRKLIKEKRIPKENRISDEFGEDYGQLLLSFADQLDREYENNTRTIEFSDDEDYEDGNLREFAFFLNFYSPSAYKYILETYNTPLPELKVLYSWYLKDDYYPGLSEKAFKILKEKSLVKRQTCSLMLIDIFLNNEGRYCDQVDYGQGVYYHFIDKAVLVYVFVLVSLDEDWKMPIGYIFARDIPAETQAEYIRICLTHCHEAGADVVAVTLENPTPAEFLGCSFGNIRHLKTTFKHPSCDRDVAVWIDPCLALKSARQTLKVKCVLKDNEDKKIRWNLIRRLKRLPEKFPDLEAPEFFELQNHIAKIDLTSHTFSKSLIPALDLAEKLLPDMFTDIEPTKRYIACMNILYNILNSRVTARMRNIGLQLKAAKKYLIRLLCNEENMLTNLDRVNLGWKRLQGYRYFLKGEPVCGFIGFLICIESFTHLYSTLIKEEKRITYLNLQRLCKEQAEDLVTNLRAYDYLDADSLSGERFQCFYKKLFEYLEDPQFSDKPVPLEHWPLQNRFPPMVAIKLTSGKRSYDDVYSSQYRFKKMKKTLGEESATKLVRDYSKAIDTEMDLSIKKNMVGFLAGWISAKFAKCLKCEVCIDLLCTDKKLWFHKFITLRVNTLCLPSEEIFRICWECERALRLKGSPMQLKAWVLRRLAAKFPWSKSPKRSKHRSLHHIHLARAVIEKYFALRVPTPFGTKDREKIVKMYQQFTTRDPDESVDKYRVEELEDWLNGSKEEDSD